MKTLIIYLDESKKNIHKITPTGMFGKSERNPDRRPNRIDWSELAIAVAPGHYSYEVVGD